MMMMKLNMTQKNEMKIVKVEKVNDVIDNFRRFGGIITIINRTIKPKYAHQGGRNPPTVVLHGNALIKLPSSYLRYLGRSLARTFKLTGTWIRFELRNAENPYDKARTSRRGRR